MSSFIFYKTKRISEKRHHSKGKRVVAVLRWPDASEAERLDGPVDSAGERHQLLPGAYLDYAARQRLRGNLQEPKYD